MREKFHILLTEKSNNLFIQLFRYTFVGGLAFLVDFSLLYVLTEYAGLHYLVSASCSFIAGLFVNYFISVFWVFGASSMKKIVEFLLFAFVGLIGLGLNDFFLWLFTEQCRIYYMLSKLMAVVLVYLWNFLGRRYFIFNKKE
jgi:putative flippase GtrA